MPRVVLLFFISCLLSLFAQAQPGWYNSPAAWGRFQLLPANTALPMPPRDTVIIVASNRTIQYGDSLRFMGEARDGKGIRYYIIYAHNRKWKVWQVHSLAKALAYMPENKDWVIYTEGMGKLFTNGVERAMYMNAFYDVNVLYLDYPSITTTKGRMGNYKFSKRNARMAYQDFLPVLDTFQQLKAKGYFSRKTISMFFHSMGSNVLREIVRNGKLPLIQDEKPWVDNLILNAACVPQKRHAEWLGQVQFAKHIYINYNPQDETLAMASLMTARKQLGQKVRPPLLPGATYINFHTLADRGHSLFLSLPFRAPAPDAALQYYRILLHGNAPPLQDSTRFRRTTYRDVGWDILPK